MSESAEGVQATESVAAPESVTPAVEPTPQTAAESVLSTPEAAKPEGQAPEDQAAKPEEAKPERRAPEEYSDFQAPDGIKLEGRELTEFKSFAKEQDLTQEQAQKVLEFAGPKIKEMIEAPHKAWQELTKQWWESTRQDTEIGGTKLEQSIKDAGQAFIPGESNPFFKTQVEVDAMREALKVTGAMHHPEVQRLFVRMGKMLAEPAHLNGKPAPQDKQEAFYNSMYPTMAKPGQG